MNIENEIARLLNRSKEVSSIRFLPYTNDLPTTVVEVNTALAHAETEEKRWELFLALLRVYTHRRAPTLGRRLFGLCARWIRDEPLVISMEINGLSIHQGQAEVVNITGDPAITTGYYFELIKKGLAMTLQKHERTQRGLSEHLSDQY